MEPFQPVSKNVFIDTSCFRIDFWKTNVPSAECTVRIYEHATLRVAVSFTRSTWEEAFTAAFFWLKAHVILKRHVNGGKVVKFRIYFDHLAFAVRVEEIVRNRAYEAEIFDYQLGEDIMTVHRTNWDNGFTAIMCRFVNFIVLEQWVPELDRKVGDRP